MKRLLLLLILYCSSTIISCSLLCAQGDTSNGLVWGPIIKLSRDSSSNNLPQIAVQGDTIHVTWLGDDNFNKLPYSRSTNGGKTFMPVRDLIDDSVFQWAVPYEKIIASKTMVYIFIAGLSSQGRSPVYMLRSSDAGSTWSSPTPITTDSTTQLQHASIHGDTMQIQYRAPRDAPFKFTISTDGGETWNTPSSAILHATDETIDISSKHLHRVYELGETYYLTSDDLGNSWSAPIRLSTADGASSDKPHLGIEENSNNDFNIYTAWRDQKYGGDFGGTIIFRQSTDGGVSWMNEYRMNPQPDGITTGGNFAIYNNFVGLAWTKFISLGTDHIQFRYSTDRGITWLPSYFPSGTEEPQNAGNSKCVASPSGFHIVWEQNTDAGFGIFYRRGAFLSTGVKEPEQKPSTITLAQNYPNPFNPVTAIGYSLLAIGNVTLKVYNIYGQEVATLVNKREAAGEHRVEFNAGRLPSGLYFYRLTAYGKDKSFVQTRKMMLMK